MPPYRTPLTDRTMTTLLPAPTALPEPAAPARVIRLTDADADAIHDGKAAATWAACRRDWQHFVAWCDQSNHEPMPAAVETLTAYVHALADGACAGAPNGGYRASTITRRLSSISQAHQAAGHLSPTGDQTFRLIWRDVRNRLGRQGKVAPPQAAPALIDTLRAMVATCDTDTLRGLRNRTVLLVGFAGAFRRSELVSLDVADVRKTTDGLDVHLRRSKTDQAGEGRMLAIPYGSDRLTCPVRTWVAWRYAAELDDGPAFRPTTPGDRVTSARLSDRAVSRIVKGAAAAAGLDPAAFSGHSLRRDFATQAARAGKGERAIMRQTGHLSTAMVRRYIEDADRWTDNAAVGIGLLTKKPCAASCSLAPCVLGQSEEDEIRDRLHQKSTRYASRDTIRSTSRR
jgi:site-specific recombinase XerD